MAKIKILAFLLLIAIFTTVFAVNKLNTPLSCKEMVDVRLFNLLNSEYNTVDELKEIIGKEYSIELNSITIYPQEEVTLLIWKVGQIEHLAYYKELYVRSIWVTNQGLFPKYPNSFELNNCFGNASHARVQFITHEIGRLEYQLWYLDQGIVFQGGITIPRNTPLMVTNNEVFDTYIIFNPTSLTEAVDNIYVVNSEPLKDTWLKNIKPWGGSWSGIEIQTETP